MSICAKCGKRIRAYDEHDGVIYWEDSRGSDFCAPFSAYDYRMHEPE